MRSILISSGKISMDILDGRGKVEVSDIGVVMLDIQTQSPPISLSLQASKPVYIFLEAG